MRTIRTPFQQSLLGYLIAIVATAAVATIRLAISDTVGNFAPTGTFTVAIVIAAWYSGLGPGLLATALSALTADYLLTPAHHTFRIATSSGAVSLGVMVFTGVLLSLLCESLHRTRRRLEAERANLRDSVELQRQMRDALTESDRRKDEFLATLAHELRNPLAPVRNAIHILRAKLPATPELHWARDVIDRQVTQMTRLIDDLMDVSRITRGTFELRREYVALDEVIRVAVETSRPIIDASGHQLAVYLPAEPIDLHADLIRLAQVFSNLLNNAAKYTGHGGRIAVTAERAGGMVCVAVQDTGIGIPAEMLTQVFEPFTQLDRSLERTRGGLGIGLALAKRLVEMHGGTIEAHSPGLEHGSRFVVRLPVAAHSSVARPVALEGRGPAPAVGSHRILVADDNYDSATSLSILLNDAGYDVRTAGDGAQALETAAQFRPDVALLDIGMPKLNGYEVARQLRNQPWGRHVLLIAVTGWGGVEHRQQTAQAGFDHHLTKPVDPAALTRLLVSLLTETGSRASGSVAT
ncbi:MAG: chemotaxis protein methyltransferase CheR [Gammaproteobacteria bacterium]|nr:chemotaxis protein methyltransferase CheR [Gammaproteobacteria bacterium]